MVSPAPLNFGAAPNRSELIGADPFDNAIHKYLIVQTFRARVRHLPLEQSTNPTPHTRHLGLQFQNWEFYGEGVLFMSFVLSREGATGSMERLRFSVVNLVAAAESLLAKTTKLTKLKPTFWD
ncbi:hypothetical protein PHJA_002472400 [Phtheirospermum japonicum]|uniref:Uncharacterized protein n=1 Tax=Phtheirospermum japonicum TaxID=374723 RepID=A0A830D806_9LAMI|nr:hypothetical protein PHJA_002472400 [Phtheirospermum japonicum]